MVIVVLALTELTDNVADHDGLTRLDGPWHRWLVDHRSPGLTMVMDGVSTAGSTAVLAIVAVVVSGWLAWRRRWPEAVLVGLTTAGAGLLVPLLKNLVDRPRPPVTDRLMVETSWSYPSGHSLGATAVVGALTLVAVVSVSRWFVRVALVACGVLLIAVIGFSRIYLGVHWPSDVLAGWLVGGLWLAVCHTLVARTRARRAHRREVRCRRGQTGVIRDTGGHTSAARLINAAFADLADRHRRRSGVAVPVRGRRRGRRRTVPRGPDRDAGLGSPTRQE